MGKKSRLAGNSMLLIFLSASCLHAGNVTWNYTGEDFSNVASPYTTSDFVSAQVTFSAPLASGQSVEDMTGSIVSWSITDQDQIFSSADSGFLAFGNFGTDGEGNIDEWQLVACDTSADCQANPATNEVVTYNLFPPDFSTVVVDAGVEGDGQFGQIEGEPGVWSLGEGGGGEGAPEPGTFFLLGGAFAGALAVRRHGLRQ